MVTLRDAAAGQPKRYELAFTLQRKQIPVMSNVELNPWLAGEMCHSCRVVDSPQVRDNTVD